RRCEPGGCGLWDVVHGSVDLSMLHAANTKLAGGVAVGKAPHWATSTSDGRTAFVSNEGSNDVVVVDLASRTVTATIPVGNAPRKIAVQPVSNATATTPAPVQPARPASGKSKSITLGSVTYA